MQARLSLAFALASVLLAACSSSSNAPRAVPAPPALNNNGSPVTAVITARFDPSAGVVPFPTNLLLSGTTDLTLNIPVPNPNDFSNPQVAINALDGWGTVAPWSTTFSAAVAPSSVVAGQSVRLFEVTLTGPGGGVTGVVRELSPGTEFVTALAPSDPTNRTLVIIPTRPLQQLTSYMAVITNGIRDTAGNDATPDQPYFLAKRTSPLVDAAGNSTDPLLPSATARALEPLRQLVNSQEAAAASRGIPRDRIVLSWVATTQGITPVMSALRSTLRPTSATLVPTGQNIGQLSGGALPPIADVFIGFVELPYFLEAPTAQNPTALLTTFWRAAPGAYVPPFNTAGLNPNSTFVTFANPLPVVRSTQRVPVLVTIPNANSGRQRPGAGWPVAIFQHGITGNRTQAIGIAAAMAQAGFAVVAIDLPLHGLPPTNPLHVSNTPFAGIARERTFDVDLLNNQTGAPGPDGIPDASGAHFINLSSLLTSRDNLRQAAADLSTLALTIPFMDANGDGAPDFDGARIHFVGQSLGAMVGTVFLANEPTVNVGVLSVPGGGIARLLEASPTFGPQIRAGLAAAAGLQPGTPAYDQYFAATQIVIDSADPINWGIARVANALFLQQVDGDLVVPNAVAGAPLSGTQPLIAALGLQTIGATLSDPNGVRAAVRMSAGDHGSLLSPVASPAATIEMQGQAASMMASDGRQVVISNPSVIRTP